MGDTETLHTLAQINQPHAKSRMATSKIQGNTDTGWRDMGGSWAGATRKYRVKNGYCTISVVTWGGDSNPDFVAGQWNTIGTLPSEARPSIEINCSAGNRSLVTAEVIVYPSGNVSVYPSETTKHLLLSACFPVG